MASNKTTYGAVPAEPIEATLVSSLMSILFLFLDLILFRVLGRVAISNLLRYAEYSYKRGGGERIF